MKRIDNTLNDFNHCREELKPKCFSRRHKLELLKKHVKAIEKMDRKETTPPQNKQISC